MESTCTLRSMHAIHILGMIYFWFWVDLELVYRTLQQILRFSTFSSFSYFSMDKIKASQLGNWELLFPTHPPIIFLHFIGLEFYFHLLDKSLMIFPTREVLDRFSKCFIHLWGFLYFGKSAFLSFMSCFHTIRLSHEGSTIYVHYYS